jgi:phenylpropionate dioxygenase-like ring-hydroxylating dioxygenase large terminal subunit
MHKTDPVLIDQWHPVARAEDLQPGTVLSKRLLGEDIVLWRYEERTQAWQDFCPHRSVRLSLGWVQQDTLVCPYHGLAYNLEGKCVSLPPNPDQPIPHRACIRIYQTKECYGLIWVCLGQPTQDILPFPEWDDPTYRKILGGPYCYCSSPQRAFENFLDTAHIHFLHKGILGEPSHARVDHHQVEWHVDGITYSVDSWEHDFNENGEDEMIFKNYKFNVFRPLTAHSQTAPVEQGIDRQMAIFFTVSPVEEEECVVWIWMALNYCHRLLSTEIEEALNLVSSQDITMVESQRPRRLPLDLQAEFHLSCDHSSVAYRKWLKQLGVTFGVI